HAERQGKKRGRYQRSIIRVIGISIYNKIANRYRRYRNCGWTIVEQLRRAAIITKQEPAERRICRIRLRKIDGRFPGYLGNSERPDKLARSGKIQTQYLQDI